MYSDENQRMTFVDYKNMEVALHRDLMNSCRRYINKLSIVSVLGILEIVKQEAIELEKATNRILDEPNELSKGQEEPFTDTIQ